MNLSHFESRLGCCFFHSWNWMHVLGNLSLLIKTVSFISEIDKPPQAQVSVIRKNTWEKKKSTILSLSMHHAMKKTNNHCKRLHQFRFIQDKVTLIFNRISLKMNAHLSSMDITNLPFFIQRRSPRPLSVVERAKNQYCPLILAREAIAPKLLLRTLKSYLLKWEDWSNNE